MLIISYRSSFVIRTKGIGFRTIFIMISLSALLFGCGTTSKTKDPSPNTERIRQPFPSASHNFCLNQNIPVDEVKLDEHIIRKADLVATKISEKSFIIALHSVKGQNVSMTSVDAKGKFVIVDFEFTNNDSEDTHVFPLLYKGFFLIDDFGQRYKLADREMTKAAHVYPKVTPGNSSKFDASYDVPKDSVPRFIHIESIDTLIELRECN